MRRFGRQVWPCLNRTRYPDPLLPVLLTRGAHLRSQAPFIWSRVPETNPVLPWEGNPDRRDKNTLARLTGTTLGVASVAKC